MHSFETATQVDLDAMSPTQRHAYDRWFWEWMNGERVQDADFQFDVKQERINGYTYDRT